MKFIGLSSLLFLLLFCVSVHADEFVISQQTDVSQSIQDLVGLVGPGTTTIHFLNGTYTGCNSRVDFDTGTYVVNLVGAGTELTVIDCGGSGPVNNTLLYTSTNAIVGIYNMTIKGVKNSATSSGNLIYARGGLVLSHVTVTDCVNAGQNGAIVQVITDTAVVTHSTFTLNGPCRFGALYLSTVIHTVEDCVFDKNTGTDYAGGLYIYRGSGSVTRTNFTLNSSGNNGQGAAVHANEAFTNFTNCVFEGNSARDGGAMRIVGGGHTRLISSTFIGNIASRDGGHVESLTSSNVTAIHCLFDDGSAVNDGGAVYLGSSVTFIARNCTFQYNFALDGGGGVSLIDSAEFTAAECSFVGNVAIGNGGGVRATDETHLFVSDSVFVLNTADVGGGIHTSDCTSNIKSSSFSLNSAHTDSAGGYIGGYPPQSLSAEDLYFADNSISYTASSDGTVSFDGSGLVENVTVVRSRGGWSSVFFGGFVDVHDIVVRDCISLTYSGGFRVELMPAITIEGATVVNNTCEQSCTGGIALQDAFDAELIDITLTDNEFNSLLVEHSNVVVTSISCVRREADNSVFIIEDSSTFVVSGGTFVGGGLTVYGDTNGVTFVSLNDINGVGFGNDGESRFLRVFGVSGDDPIVLELFDCYFNFFFGGVIYASGSVTNLTLTQVVFDGVSSPDSGGAVIAYNIHFLSVVDCGFTSASASNGGGGIDVNGVSLPVLIEDVGVSGGSGGYGGFLACRNAHCRVHNSVIENVIVGTIGGGAIGCHEYGRLDVSHTSIRGCVGTTSVALGTWDTCFGLTVKETVVEDNRGSGDGALMILQTEAPVLFEDVDFLGGIGEGTDLIKLGSGSASTHSTQFTRCKFALNTVYIGGLLREVTAGNLTVESGQFGGNAVDASSSEDVTLISLIGGSSSRFVLTKTEFKDNVVNSFVLSSTSGAHVTWLNVTIACSSNGAVPFLCMPDVPALTVYFDHYNDPLVCSSNLSPGVSGSASAPPDDLSGCTFVGGLGPSRESLFNTSVPCEPSDYCSFLFTSSTESSSLSSSSSSSTSLTSTRSETSTSVDEVVESPSDFSPASQLFVWALIGGGAGVFLCCVGGLLVAWCLVTRRNGAAASGDEGGVVMSGGVVEGDAGSGGDRRSASASTGPLPSTNPVFNGGGGDGLETRVASVGGDPLKSVQASHRPPVSSRTSTQEGTSTETPPPIRPRPGSYAPLPSGGTLASVSPKVARSSLGPDLGDSGYTTNVMPRAKADSSGYTTNVVTGRSDRDPSASVVGPSFYASTNLDDGDSDMSSVRSGRGDGDAPSFPGMTNPVVLGRGGQATVYSAFSFALGYQVCLKVFVHVDAFERETAVLARVPPHPNIVALLDVQALPPATMAMKLALKGNLAELLSTTKMSRRDVISVALGLAQGLTHLHSAGVCHLDIKPANVLLNPDNQGGLVPIITDFGASFVQGRADLRVDMCTVKYAAPEVLAMIGGKSIVEAGLTSYTGLDVYSFGVTVWEMAVGQAPHEGKSQGDIVRDAMANPLDFRVKASLVPDGDLRAIVEFCTRKPDSRTQNFTDFLRDLSSMA